jgi:hypothetical protein
MPGLWVQDAACQAGVSPVYDRTRENLCASDTGVVRTRRVLLGALAALQERGELPHCATHPEAFMARAVSLSLSKDAEWAEAGREPMQARVGRDLGYEP